MDRAAPARMAAWTRVVRGGGLRTSRVLVVRSGWRVMTREQLVRAEAIALADARRMASALATQAHDEGHARVSTAVRSKAQLRPARPAAMAWSPHAMT